MCVWQKRTINPSNYIIHRRKFQNSILESLPLAFGYDKYYPRAVCPVHIVQICENSKIKQKIKANLLYPKSI